MSYHPLKFNDKNNLLCFTLHANILLREKVKIAVEKTESDSYLEILYYQSQFINLNKKRLRRTTAKEDNLCTS